MRYECKITTGRDGHTYAQCGIEEDNYIIQPDFSNFPRGGLAIGRQFGPNETEEESENVDAVHIEKREIVDKLKDFLSSSDQMMTAEDIVREDFIIKYKFMKESHGWLKVEMYGDLLGKVLIHKDIVPVMKKIIDENFV
jgi:hypothetical protein